MTVRKIAISLSVEALELVDHSAAEEGISRSAWFERASRRAQRLEGMRSSLRALRRLGVKPTT